MIDEEEEDEEDDTPVHRAQYFSEDEDDTDELAIRRNVRYSSKSRLQIDDRDLQDEYTPKKGPKAITSRPSASAPVKKRKLDVDANGTMGRATNTKVARNR